MQSNCAFGFAKQLHDFADFVIPLTNLLHFYEHSGPGSIVQHDGDVRGDPEEDSVLEGPEQTAEEGGESGEEVDF